MTYAELVKFHGASNYWRLGETSGTTAVDVISGANGTISGGVTLGQSGPIADSNKAMTFDGATGKIAVPITRPGIVTLEAWAKRTSGGSGFSRVYDEASFAFLLAITTTFHPHFFLVFTDASNTGWVDTSVTIPVNTWVHLALVWDGTWIRFYMNGMQGYAANTWAGKTLAASTSPTISASTSEGWPGSLDEVAIYPRVLTAQEINAHYTTGLTNNFIIPTTLISIGPTIPINANEIYAIPNVPVILQAGAQVQTSILFNGPFTNVSNGQINGVYLKSAVNTTVKLTKYIIAA